MPGCLLYVGGPRVGPTQWRRCWKLLGISGGGPESKSTSRGESRSPGKSQKTEPRKMEDGRQKTEDAKGLEANTAARSTSRTPKLRVEAEVGGSSHGRRPSSSQSGCSPQNSEPCILVGRRKQIDGVIPDRERTGISLRTRKNGNPTGRGGRTSSPCVACSVRTSWTGDRRRQNLARDRPLLDMGWRYPGWPVRLRTWKCERAFQGSKASAQSRLPRASGARATQWHWQTELDSTVCTIRLYCTILVILR